MDTLHSEDPSLRVRLATRKDWEALREIRLESLRDSPGAFGSTIESALDISPRRWRERIAARPFYLAERDARVVGLASGGFDDRFPGTHWLYSMYVTPLERGRGAAKMLVEAVIGWARAHGATLLYLDVASGADRAQAFYRKMGFVPTGHSYPLERDPSVSESTMTKQIEPEFRVEEVDAARLFDLRRRILRNNDPSARVDDPHDRAATSRHFAGVLGEHVVVSASFYLEPSPVREQLVSYQLRFMAVALDQQGRGYGARVLTTAQDVLRALGAQQLWANARDSALGFYEAMGWEILAHSAHVSAATNLPHQRIAKLL
ncbi:MAG TPA: GNAT family N-acetyltransferase [Acidimicrobiales bacterium]|jgi:GNAT superfamily N-acetyltransferase